MIATADVQSVPPPLGPPVSLREDDERVPMTPMPWRTLNRQFLGMSTAMLTLGMLIQGMWIWSTIQKSATHHATLAAVAFIDHFIAPHLRDITTFDPPPADLVADLDSLLERTSPTIQLITMHIWTTDGRIIHSTDRRMIGQRFLPSSALKAATRGDVTSELDQHEDAHAAHLGGQSLLEVYVPVRNAANEVIAAVEFYMNADRIQIELVRTKRAAWGVTAAVFLVMIAGLWIIFMGAGSVIDKQRQSLLSKVAQLSELLSQNHDLQQRISRSSRHAADENERFLLSIGADLHDGPAQAIGYALLRLDALGPAASGVGPQSSAAEDVESIRLALTDAMNEIRHICGGLSMPEIQDMSLAEALESVIRRHEQRTHTTVEWHMPTDLPAKTRHFAKVSLCRFVQEGLNNAYRHAGGSMQSVQAWTDGCSCFVKVEDGGPGMSTTPVTDQRQRLGLAGLTNRIQSWGGSVTVTSLPGLGTRLTAAMPLESCDEGSKA